MNKPQWSDLGMFLQTFMLLAVDAGLDTCAQESWSMYPKAVADFCGAPEDLMLFCGMAIGYRDSAHPVNRLRSERTPVCEFATWVEA
jgi:nitroreductase